MGEVWVADQLEPLRRRVALKLIKPGMDSRQVLARFEAERQALALMDHPNIAKVLDAGTAADQRPYFVMELVKGTPITTFCDARRLSLRERLELFIPVCQAIQHAHTKGIIHRDIKPSNVLVALHDERPAPKVIDFGVAKAVGQQLTEKTVYTGFGALVGTPSYMAPEQATFNQLDIDTRADVYALGVLLYELLAGSPPVEPERMKKAAFDEMLRLVREEEPPRPSQRLSTSQSKASIAAVRQMDPAKLTGLIQGELDWIVMKSLEKDRNRRYETANGFAADIQRYLAGEQVQAVPPSTAYRLRKFARKNLALLTTVTAFAGLLIAFAAVSGWLALKAMRAESVAEEKRIEAEANAKDAAEQSALHQKASIAHFDARLEAEILARGLQVDLDLESLNTDTRLGLLRLAKPYKQDLKGIKLKHESDDPAMQAFLAGAESSWDDDHETLKAIRGFVTATVLANGQAFAPLLPPMTHDGQEVVNVMVSPDKQTLLTLGKDFTARLWDTKTAKQIAVLRQGNERVVNGGFSPDGRTVFTDDQTSIARFWDVPSGKFRAATEARPNRYVIPDKWLVELGRSATPLIVGQGRVLAQRYVVTNVTDQGSGFGGGISSQSHWEGPIELWDTATGRFVGQLDVPSRIIDKDRLDVPGRIIDDLQFLGDRWITAKQDNALLVFSAHDGRRLARLEHPKSEGLQYGVYASPNGHRIATISSDEHATVRLWDTASWQLKASTMSIEIPDGWGWDATFVTDELFEVAEGWESQVWRFGHAEPVARFRAAALIGTSPCLTVDHLMHLGDGRIMDMRNWQVLVPPAGRKYHPDLAQFAPDGRFVLAGTWEPRLIDTQVEKSIDSIHSFMGGPPIANLPGIGWFTAETNYAAQIMLIPTPGRDIPPDLLDLWAQVAVRGELGSDGRFVKWNEEKWEQKRQQLAAVAAPHLDFPFPGYVATDNLHWLRAEYQAASSDADKQRLAKELLQRAEACGNKVEAGRWRATLADISPKDTPAPLLDPK